MAIDRFTPRHGMTRRQRGPELGGLPRLDDLFDRFMRDVPAFSTEGGSMTAPDIDVIDRKDEIVVRADLPGLEEKDVQVEIRDGQLTLRGERSGQREEKNEDYFRVERWDGSFYRSIELPPGVDSDKAEAKFKNGVLEIALPKSKESKGKKIEIKGS